ECAVRTRQWAPRAALAGAERSAAARYGAAGIRAAAASASPKLAAAYCPAAARWRAEGPRSATAPTATPQGKAPKRSRQAASLQVAECLLQPSHRLDDTGALGGDIKPQEVFASGAKGAAVVGGDSGTLLDPA